MTLTIPRKQTMVDGQGMPTVPYQRFMDELGRRLGSAEGDIAAITSLPVTPEDFGAIGDGTTDDTVALQAFFDNTTKFGRLTAGATYLVDSDSITVPGNTRWWGPRSATIKNADAVGATLLISADDVELKGFSINGGNSAATVAAGYVSGHTGIEVTGSSSDLITDIRLIDLSVTNCGYIGIDLVHVTRAIISGCVVSRCGYIGIEIANSTYVLCDGNTISNIYPGDNPGNSGTNCYGITATRYTASSVRPANVWLCRNSVSSVVWEGIDEHDGTDIWFIDNSVSDVGQGIAVQHDEVGYAARRITIIGNVITGFGGTSVIEGVTYRPTAGIICIGGLGTNLDASGQGQSLTIANNIVRSIGDNRSSPGASGGIMFQHWRDFKVVGNSLFACYRHGIVSNDDTNSRNEFGLINSNVIDAVQSVGGVCRDIYVSTFCAALVTGNFAAGSGDGFNQAGGPTLVSSITGNYLYS